MVCPNARSENYNRLGKHASRNELSYSNVHNLGGAVRWTATRQHRRTSSAFIQMPAQFDELGWGAGLKLSSRVSLCATRMAVLNHSRLPEGRPRQCAEMAPPTTLHV
jgi:hypothetical protein